jgi:hypothetical protein
MHWCGYVWRNIHFYDPAVELAGDGGAPSPSPITLAPFDSPASTASYSPPRQPSLLLLSVCSPYILLVLVCFFSVILLLMKSCMRVPLDVSLEEG